MRFFSGGRDASKKKTSASALYKQKMSGKPVVEKTPDEKYKEAIAAKMQKLMEDAIMGRKKQASVAGIKGKHAPDDEKPRELSKNAQMMLKLLAMQKLKQDAKKEKKKLREQLWAEKAKKKAAAMAKAAKEELEYQNKLDAEAASAAAATPYTYGYTNHDDNNGW